MFDGMVDLALTPTEVKEDLAEMMPTASPKASVPKYPYGLCLSIEDETLDKLDLDGDLPEVGEMIYFRAVAKVTCASDAERETGDGTTKRCRRVELQIISMGIPPTDAVSSQVAASEARRKRFYDHDEPDGDVL